MLTSARPRLHFGSLLLICSLTLTLFLLAGLSGKPNLLVHLLGDPSGSSQLPHEPSEIRHDLLDDVSNATLGVRLSSAVAHYF